MSNKMTKGESKSITSEVRPAVALLRTMIFDGRAHEALDTVQNFIAVAMYVMERTNPSKIRNAALAVQIKAYMDKSV